MLVRQHSRDPNHVSLSRCFAFPTCRHTPSQYNVAQSDEYLCAREKGSDNDTMR